MLGHEYDDVELLREFEEDLGISTHPFELSLASNLSLQREKLMGLEVTQFLSHLHVVMRVLSLLYVDPYPK